METQEITLRVKLKTSYTDMLGYTNYVFENLNFQNYDYQYLTCVRFPNWNQSPFNIEEEGYLVFKNARAGIDKWFDGKDFHVYKEDMFIFLKFIHIKPQQTSDILLD